MLRYPPSEPLRPDAPAPEGSLSSDAQRIRDMVELSAGWFWEQDADFRFVALSKEWQGNSAIAPPAILGRCRWELPVTGVTEAGWDAHRLALNRHETFHDFEYQVIDKAGASYWFTVSGKPVFDAAGAFTGYRGSGRDITTQKQAALALQQSEQRLRALLELSSDWYWEMDAGHRLTLREGAVLKRLGARHDADIGKTWWELDYINMGTADWARVRGVFERREELRDLLLERPAADGSIVSGLLSGKPRFGAGGEFIGYHGVGRGITALRAAERARNASQTEFDLVMDSAPAAIACYDRELRVQVANQACYRLFGRDAVDARGSRLRDIVGEQVFAQIEPHFRTVLRGEAASYQRVIHDTQGAARTIEVRLVPRHDAAGQTIGCYSIIMDVTGMLQAEESVRSLQHLFTSTFQHTTDLMAVYRVEADDLLIEGFNRALVLFYEARYPGLRVADWFGRSIRLFLREVSGLSEPDTTARLARFWEAARTGTVLRYQTDLPTPAGIQRRDALLVPVTDGAGRVTHLFYRGADLTDLARKEQELQALNLQLEQRVAARTADLAASNQELAAFAYAVSHDLRTPLRGIDGFSRLLDEEYGPALGDEGRGYVQRVRRGIARMGDLIDDLLRLSQVTRGPLKRSRVDLSALAAEVTAELARQEPARAIDWRITPNVWANADAGLMRLLLENLLGNAFKYSRAMKPAVIAFDGALEAGGGVRFSVTDNGAGFDMTYAAKLFQPFQRLHNPREFEGTGIGLATVWRIVRRHHGSIEGRGEPGKGAQFSVVLPPPPQEVASNQTPPEEAA